MSRIEISGVPYMVRNWLRKFMLGRYGPDHLNVALFVLVIILDIANAFAEKLWLGMVSMVIIFFAMFRMLSRNIYARRRENDRFLRFWWPIWRKIKGFIDRRKNGKGFRFFKCPACRNMLRVPRGKGKIMVTCPKCGEKFQKKT